ncbi:hypothetical protein [Shewanella surugensis]|uniref:Uncharacterized protein n=1 Tax=Shewanella surugensis TaxID=212020 RepID=A0ABT0LEX4_9GAMM|nr:hypothetical protein [Shewanella surugensis]MCL1125706.1 hypothetical protein [Shewanella surugensis]
MTEEQFNRTLQSVGQSCFVKFFDVFSSKVSTREEMIEKLKSETDYTEGSCISRTSHAKSLIEAGVAGRVFEQVINSNSSKISDETRDLARKYTINSNI